MSTTAEPQQTLENQEQAAQGQAAQQGQAGATSPVPPNVPPTAPEPKSNTREYILFEEARADTWTQIGKAEADNTEAALDTLGDQKLKSGQRFVAIPSRFFVPRKPKVTTITTISYD